MAKRLTASALYCEMMDCPAVSPDGSGCVSGTCYSRRLQPIYGDKFAPWEERYGG